MTTPAPVHTMYLEVFQVWVDQTNLNNAIKARLVEPGHIRVVATPDDSGTSRIVALMNKIKARFGGEAIDDYVRKNQPDTVELGVFDADSKTMKWA